MGSGSVWIRLEEELSIVKVDGSLSSVLKSVLGTEENKWGCFFSKIKKFHTHRASREEVVITVGYCLSSL